MSWDAYRDNLVASGNCRMAAVVGIEDGRVWSQSQGMNLSDAEARMVVSGFNNPSVLQNGGIIIGGKKYMTLRVEDLSIQGKLGAGGVSVARSAKCALIIIYGEGVQPGNASKTVQDMSDYLRNSGY